MSPRGAVTSRLRDGIEPRTLSPHKYGLGLYFSIYKRGQGVAAKKKKWQKDDKNALRYNYQRAIERTRETYARTVL